jgi:hypothetical protein
MLLVTTGLLLGGCLDIALVNTIQLELVNDTSFPVDANIRFDDDSNWLAGLFPAEDLNAGRIESGETVTFNFDCDELGVVFSDEAEQLGLFFTYVADSTSVLSRDDEYECGDVVRFRFVGNGDDFGVIVSVNGRVVD